MPLTPTLAAAVWMTGAIASFTSMAIAGRAVSDDLDTFEIMLFRSLVGIFIVTSVALFTRQTANIRRTRLGLHALRNLLHFAGQNLWFFAITLIPLAQVFSIEFSAPLWVTLMAPLFLGERITLPRAAAAILGFTGILIVARPDFGHLDPGIIAIAIAAICFAGTAICTKRLTQTEPILSILFWLTVMQAVFGITMAGWDGDITLPDPRTAPWLVLIGCAGLFAHFCLTQALRCAPAVIVMPMDFVRLPVAAFVGALFYNEGLDGIVFLGAGLIIIGNFLNLWAETKRDSRLNAR